MLSSGGGVSVRRELYRLCASQPAGDPCAGPWLASKYAGSPGQAIRSVPPYLGGSAPPRLVQRTITTSRPHPTSHCFFIWVSFSSTGCRQLCLFPMPSRETSWSVRQSWRAVGGEHQMWGVLRFVSIRVKKQKRSTFPLSYKTFGYCWRTQKC